MKKFIFILSFLFFLKSYSSCICFFHGGASEIPDYAYESFKQAALFNSDSKIYIITNLVSIKKIRSWELPENFVVYIDKSIPTSRSTKIFFRKRHKLRTSLLDWYCYERFFRIRDLSAHLGLNDVIYAEYDNMLYFDVENSKKAFLNVNIGIPFISDEMGICGVAYFKNSNSLEELCKFVLENWNLKDTDMVFWAKFKNAKPDIVHDLPVLPLDCEYALKKTISWFVPTKGYQEFLSVFDPAPYGQFLGGFFSGSPGDINPCAAYDPSVFEYVWIKDQVGRKIPYLKDNHGQMSRINNLHIHSKKLDLFRSL
jgi:hypothetical protein